MNKTVVIVCVAISLGIVAFGVALPAAGIPSYFANGESIKLRASSLDKEASDSWNALRNDISGPFCPNKVIAEADSLKLSIAQISSQLGQLPDHPRARGTIAATRVALDTEAEAANKIRGNLSEGDAPGDVDQFFNQNKTALGMASESIDNYSKIALVLQARVQQRKQAFGDVDSMEQGLQQLDEVHSGFEAAVGAAVKLDGPDNSVLASIDSFGPQFAGFDQPSWPQDVRNVATAGEAWVPAAKALATAWANYNAILESNRGNPYFNRAGLRRQLGPYTTAAKAAGGNYRLALEILKGDIRQAQKKSGPDPRAAQISADSSLPDNAAPASTSDESTGGD